LRAATQTGRALIFSRSRRNVANDILYYIHDIRFKLKLVIGMQVMMEKDRHYFIAVVKYLVLLCNKY